MQRSTERILTTHTGSLPRPPGVALPGTAEALAGSVAGEDEIRGAVAETVGRQREAGVDVINDGEVSKPSYATYITTRLTGFEGTSVNTWTPPEATDFPSTSPGSAETCKRRPPTRRATDRSPIATVTTSPATSRTCGRRARERGERRLYDSASPGVISLFMANQYYPTHEDYISALADAMKEEYDAIAAAGFILQIDCPTSPRDGRWSRPTARRLRNTARPVRSTSRRSTTPPVTSHRSRCACTSAGELRGPHNHDVALSEIIDVVLRARPAGLLFEAANPRHAHEWVVFEDVAVPDGKVLIPGVLDSTDNYIEHPELIAQRIERLAAIVGKENVMAGSDCGFATFAQ